MEIQENIINKVAENGLLSFDPADLYPAGDRVLYDITIFHGWCLTNHSGLEKTLIKYLSTGNYRL